MSTPLLRAITGKLALLPAPKTTEPALPAVVFAVQTSEGETYFIARGVSGFYTPDTWKDAALQPGDTIAVHGRVVTRQSLIGDTFQALTLSHIAPAQPAGPHAH